MVSTYIFSSYGSAGAPNPAIPQHRSEGVIITIGLGFDTGGTYTDAVIMDLDSGKIICKAKSLTTREDLSIGIRGSIAGFDADLLKQVGVVSMSSTLATNSVVEGKGCRVGLVCIGSEYNNSVRADFDTVIGGGHDLHGEELNPLDEDAARRFLESLKGKVDGVAITGYLAVRNPSHEKRVKEIAKEILDVPIVCGHELSSGLGFNERTATCVMNAKLIPVIDDLIRSVKAVLSEKGIHAPLMIVKGDGSMMGEAVAKERPVETILCGPAASLIGAMYLTGQKDAIVMDMGGTTTDIGILRDGKPRLEPEGAIIGGKRTRVMAAEIATSGIGGDSRILVNGRRIILSSLRVVPLCIAASHWDCVKEHMVKLAGVETRPTPESFGEENVLLDNEMFRTLKMPKDETMVSEADMKLLKLLQERPYSLNEAGEILDIHPFTFNMMKLEGYGLIQRIGLTPTDLLHADGTYVQFDAEASKAGVEYLARRTGKTPQEFIDEAKQKIREKLCIELMKELMSEEVGSYNLTPAGEDMLMKAIRHNSGKDFNCTIKVNKPIIGIGAPAGVYIRWVGEVFDTDVYVTEDSDVGNAIGAITSSVSESVSFLLRPELAGEEDCKFEAFSKLGNFKYENLQEALAESERLGRESVIAAVESSGAEDVTVSVDRDERKYAIGAGESSVLMEIRLTVTAAGKPRQFTSSK